MASSVSDNGVQYDPEIVLTYLGREKLDAISQRAFSRVLIVNQNAWISIRISLKFVPKASIKNIAAFVQIMVRRPPADTQWVIFLHIIPSHYRHNAALLESIQYYKIYSRVYSLQVCIKY